VGLSTNDPDLIRKQWEIDQMYKGYEDEEHARKKRNNEEDKE
jgi:hypothetical protein